MRNKEVCLMERKTGFAALCLACGLPEPTPEHYFALPRKWRFDWAWPDRKIALEQEGGAWTGGRHTRGKGFLNDMEKYNAAALAGWLLIRATPQMVNSGEAIELLLAAFQRQGVKEL
jgi:hypothetical protein